MPDHTYYAELHLSGRADDERDHGSSRPRMRLRWRCVRGVPIFAATTSSTRSVSHPIAEPEEEAEEIIDEFKDFIESVNPDDFAS